MISFTARKLPPYEITELEAPFVIEALLVEMDRLKRLAAHARDRADRRDWAIMRLGWSSLRSLRMRIELDLDDLGPAPPEVLQELEHDLLHRGREMPRSKANAAFLKAEREGKTKG